jgi:hypothetical protein
MQNETIEKITGPKSRLDFCTLSPYGKHGSLGAQWKSKISHHRVSYTAFLFKEI